MLYGHGVVLMAENAGSLGVAVIWSHSEPICWTAASNVGWLSTTCEHMKMTVGGGLFS